MPTAIIGILSLAVGAGSAILQKRQADKIERPVHSICRILCTKSDI